MKTDFEIDVFLKYFPEIYEYYDDALDSVCSQTECERVAGDLPFASYTLNVGQQSVCRLHVDGCNPPGGVCLASPYGDFSYREEGHLILHELNLVLALPPGSFILFPSALISHQNIPIRPGKERRSFTAFSPGSMFQWIENGFDPVPKRSKAEKNRLGHLEWKRQKKRFPSLLELRKTKCIHH